MSSLHYELSQLTEKAETIQTDLAELAESVQQDEIDPATAQLLTEKYRLDLAEVNARISHLQESIDVEGVLEPTGENEAATENRRSSGEASEDHEEKRSPHEEIRGWRRSRKLTLTGLATAMVLIVVSIIWWPATAPPPLTPDQVDLDSISNETMEAVIAANLDNPSISGMRFALGNRYFSAGEYAQAYPHYQAILEANPAEGLEAATLVRLGWIVWDGNREAELAVSLLSQAVELNPQDPLGYFLLGQVQWCGQSDLDGARQSFTEALAIEGIAPSSEEEIMIALSRIDAGESCQ